MPYAPTVNDNSGQILAQGISAAGNNIASTIDTYASNLRQTKAYRTMAVDGLGMDPDEVDKMSLPSLQGKMQAMALKSAAAERQAKIANIQQQMQLRAAQGNRQQAQADNINGQNVNMGNFNQLVSDATQPTQIPPVTSTGDPAMGPPAQGAAGRLTPEQIQSFMGKANLSPDQMLKVARSYGAVGGAGVTPSFMEDPITGARVLINGKTTTPTGTNPSKVKPPTSFPVMDANGQPTGDTLIPHPNGKGFTINKGPESVSGALLPVLDPSTKQPIAGMGMDPTGKVHDFRTTVQKMSGTSTAPAAAAETYKSPNDVRAAFKAGTLNQAAATKILQTQFNLK